MYTKIIFLDIDGVLNSEASDRWYYHQNKGKLTYDTWILENPDKGIRDYLTLEFNPIALSNLDELLDREPDAKIVISSTWRLGLTVDELRELFSEFNFSQRIIDKTVSYRDGIRGAEIAEWVERCGVQNFVILDDDRDLEPYTKSPHPWMNRLVEVDGRDGFTWLNMLEATRIINRQIPVDNSDSV